jgi:hypothetical protein
MPDTAERLRAALGLGESAFRDLGLSWGGAFPTRHRIGEPVSLFPRIETASAEARAGKSPKGKGSAKPAG